MTFYSNNDFDVRTFADKYLNTPNLNLINEPDLTRILRSEIFVHTDKQLQAAHLILRYQPISSSFEDPKYVIKANDPRLHQIIIVVLSFLTTSPTPKGIQLVKLPPQHAAEEEPTSSHLDLEETAQVVEVSYSEEDFEVYNQLYSSESLGVTLNHLLPA